ncbi:hypothetical protein M413DRAFT_445840 [Hebeloma cylindrosporum]|uniref:Uncharacterized protein n=1 Tax=Hebeloma cylindrosporum TaxID=76867 RepID=A0A0C3CC06_HEBCY|nr:hypothetical protein M413DRAFT_445840 [Hebeloma cylindrosporum h7]
MALKIGSSHVHPPRFPCKSAYHQIYRSPTPEDGPSKRCAKYASASYLSFEIIPSVEWQCRKVMHKCAREIYFHTYE